MTDKITLGKEYKDKVTGFTGIAVATTTFLHGCRRIGLQPVVNKEGEMPESMQFDEPQLEAIEDSRKAGFQTP